MSLLLLYVIIIWIILLIHLLIMLLNRLNVCREITVAETLVLAASPSSISQSHLRRKFCGREGGKNQAVVFGLWRRG